MNQYLSYKGSGIEWIGDIPQEWNLSIVSRHFFLGRGRVISKEEIEENIGEYPVYSSQTKSNGILGYIDTFDFEGSYITWTTDGANCGTVSYRSGKFSTTNVCGLLSKKNIELDLPYFSYLLNIGTKPYVRIDINPKLMNNMMGEIPIILPSFKEQQQISNYLDHKTQQIDSLIEKTQQKIELLKEQRTSLINQVVTKGLNPDVEMKDSGVEWIGEIPISWEVTQIRFISEMMRGKFSHRPRNDERFYGGDYPFIQTGDIVSSGKFLTNFTQTLNEMGYSVSKEFPINTLVMSISGNIGDVSILKIKSCFPDSIIGFFPQKNTLIEYLFYLFLSLKDEFLKNSTVSTQMNLNVERVSSIRVPITSIQEQQQIVDYLDEQTQKIDTTIEKETQRIELLKEYRQSLISQVVTGKIDIHDEVLV